MPRPTFLSRWFSPRHTTPDLSTVAHPTPNTPSPLARPTPPAFSHIASFSHAAPHKPVAPSQAARQFPHAVSHSPHHALSSTTRDTDRTPRQEPRLNVPRPQPAPTAPGIGPRDMAETLRVQSLPAQADVFRPYQPPKGVRGDGRTHLAMDSAASANPGHPRLGLVLVLYRSSKRFKLLAGDRRDYEAYGKLQA
ncbi:hypothetical protein [Acetobacter malorum]|uniref:hypothetical protein n=1 Tax=Acetobacter malorum TaxID=178901 RepID=UPI000AD48D9C|nr:hypothetical protein [Acetobacter malorum]